MNNNQSELDVINDVLNENENSIKAPNESLLTELRKVAPGLSNRELIKIIENELAERKKTPLN